MIDLDIADERWNSIGILPILENSIALICAEFGLDLDEVEVSVLACDDQKIAHLNAEFRGKVKPTNVLSWPSVELSADVPGDRPNPPQKDAFGVIEMGDIAISFDTCVDEAKAASIPIPDHVTHLMVHGLLHLLGFDHENDADAALMEGLEIEMLAKCDIPNPYLENETCVKGTK